MALFEGYERRIAQVSSFLADAGIESLEKAEKICLDKNVDVRKIVKSIVKSIQTFHLKTLAGLI